jgi:hypothetical protein
MLSGPAEYVSKKTNCIVNSLNRESAERRRTYRGKKSPPDSDPNDAGRHYANLLDLSRRLHCRALFHNRATGRLANCRAAMTRTVLTIAVVFLCVSASAQKRKRSDEQPAYFGLTRAGAIKLGEKANAFTAAAPQVHYTSDPLAQSLRPTRLWKTEMLGLAMQINSAARHPARPEPSQATSPWRLHPELDHLGGKVSSQKGHVPRAQAQEW